MHNRKMKDDTKIEQELAWIGDAVLGLFARNWILEKEKKMDAEMFTRMTSNNFLNSLGNPTKVEAKIGLIFNNEGLEKAFDRAPVVLVHAGGEAQLVGRQHAQVVAVFLRRLVGF